MSCQTIRINGITAIVCGARPVTRKHCKFCRGAGRTVLASTLCDANISPGKTCDAGLCEKHARRQPSGAEHCPLHNGEGIAA